MPDTEEKYWLSSATPIFVKLYVSIMFNSFFNVFNVDGREISFTDEALKAFLLIFLIPSPIVTLSNSWQPLNAYGEILVTVPGVL